MLQPGLRRCDLATFKEVRLIAYRKLFDDALDPALLEHLREYANGGFVLSSPKFERQIVAMVGRGTWKGSPGRPRRRGIDGKQGVLDIHKTCSVPVFY
jgi:putative transposase